MREEIEQRLRGIARRAGFGEAPPGVVAAVLALLALAVVVAMWRWWPRNSDEASAAARGQPARVAAGARAGSRTSGGVAVAGEAAAGAGSAGSAGSAEATKVADVFVDVVGEVRRPGVYALPEGSRVEAAVDAAGGPTPDANIAAVNLAAKATDGSQIAVPAKGEPGASAGTRGTAGAGAAGSTGGGEGAVGSAGPVNINTADAVQLDALPGVGPSTAAKIVADRETNGPFASPDDLGRIPGIGPKKLEQLKPLITVQ